VGETLRTRLGLPIVDMTEEQSKFFKYHYSKMEKNLGTTVTEMEVIKKKLSDTFKQYGEFERH
jgi:hypothetical protein